MTLNHTRSYLAIPFFAVNANWAAFMFFNLLDEIYDSIDDVLENYKILIVQKAQASSTILHTTSLVESNYATPEIPADHALSLRDTYTDATLYRVNEKDYEPVRILKTAFTVPDGKYYELHVVSSMVE